MKRYKHSLSHTQLTTMNMGVLTPVGLVEVLPGDAIQHQTAALIRVTPLVAPVMHPVTVRIHHWFVPNRLVWEGWENFITGGSDGQGDGAVPPTINLSNDPVAYVNNLPDHFGLPLGVAGQVSALPFRGYNLIYNNWYRDEDLSGVVPQDTLLCQRIAWEKDYFTSARPWPQKGPDVTLPLGSYAPVVASGDGVPRFFTENDPNSPLYTSPSSANIVGSTPGTVGTPIGWATPQLRADLSGATAATVDQVRLAFALQRYQEARARFGSRYTEYLRYLGIRPSDARLQLPEYLGGGKQIINFSEVLQTGPGSTEGSPVPGGVGQMAGHGITGMRSARYRRFFEEHGFVFTLMSVRPRSMYSQGVPRQWTRWTKEDYWQRELEFVGQQEIARREIYADGTAGDDEVFGYQDRYSDYKQHRNYVSGEFRNLLDFWHYGRAFASAPALNSTFIQCEPTKRVYQEQTQNELLCQVHHSIQARRMVRKGNSSRIL